MKQTKLPNRSFNSEKRIGERHETIVRAFLEKNGVKLLPKVNDRDPDITLLDGRTVEVKSRRRKFESLADFAEKLPAIETKRRWDKKKPKPVAYVIISQFTKAMVWTQGSNARRWKVVSRPNNNGGMAECYVCPREQLHPIETLVEFLT